MRQGAAPDTAKPVNPDGDGHVRQLRYPML